MSNIISCKIFLASPSDTYGEREAAKMVVENLNKTLGPALDIDIEMLSWEDSTFPAVASYPQAAINEQIGNEYAIFVGIMWKSFGTKTLKADSGTEEEFNIAYENYKSGGTCKNIMFYFNQDPIPQDSDLEQFAKVLEFKKKISSTHGVYYGTYKGVDDFKSQFNLNLAACINSLFKKRTSSTDKSYVNPLLVSDKMAEYIESVGTDFTHPNSDTVKLSDIYVPLNIKSLDRDNKKQNIDGLSNALEGEGIKYLFVGADASGKTSLGKYLFNKYYSLNLTPIFVSGEDLNANIRQDNIIRIIVQKFEEQYKSYPVLPSSSKSNNKDFLVIIDDFQKTAKANSKYWKLLITNLSNLFDNIILISDNSVPLFEMSEHPLFEDYDKFEILGLSSTQRTELIKKWFSIGSGAHEIEDINDVYSNCDQVNKHINSILGKNYIPAYPFYILGMLQAIESTKASSSNYSLYGFYYEKIINDCFESTKTDFKDSSFYYGLLSEYCYNLFEEKLKVVSIGEFESFYNNYCKNHAVDIKQHSFNDTVAVLNQSKLLKFEQNVLLGQKYVYYFFVAKYIANNIEDSNIQTVVTNLIQRSFRNEYFNILMFITHLSKSEWVVNELISNADALFKEYLPASLESDLTHINAMINGIPQKIVGEINVEEERKKQLELEEQLDRQQEEFERDVVNYDSFELSDDVSGLDIVARLNLALKTIDLLGEVAKKYWGELKADIKYQLILSAYNLGLRALSMNLDIIGKGESEIVEFIKQQIRDKYIREQEVWDADLNKDIVQKLSNTVIINLSYLASWGIIRRVSSSVGYDKLNLTYDEIAKNHPAFSYKLIDLAIDLNYKNMPMKEIENYKEQMKSNNMCFLLLRDLVINHLYMFEESYQNKAKVFSLFDVKQQQQKYILGVPFDKRNK